MVRPFIGTDLSPVSSSLHFPLGGTSPPPHGDMGLGMGLTRLWDSHLSGGSLSGVGHHSPCSMTTTCSHVFCCSTGFRMSTQDIRQPNVPPWYTNDDAPAIHSGCHS